jgi:putative transposase
LVEESDELGAANWGWQSADGRLGKVRFGGENVGRNPTDRGKNGTKESLSVEGDGGPLGVVIGGANVPDMKLLEATIEAIVVERPEVKDCEQNLCLDRGYDNPTGHDVTKRHNYVPHIRPIGEIAVGSGGRVVERHVDGWSNEPWASCRNAGRF